MDADDAVDEGGGGGGGGADPCVGVVCPAGEVCEAGACVVEDDDGDPFDICFCGDLLRCEGDVCEVETADAASCAATDLPACNEPNINIAGGPFTPGVTARGDIPIAIVPDQTNETGGGSCQLNPSASPQGLALGFGWFGLVGLVLASFRRGKNGDLR